jgi:hypothetical protein
MTDAFALTEDQELFRREWRRLFEEKFTERAAEIDRTGEFPWDNLKVLAEAGLTGINVPEAYGGAGADSITHCILVEEVARVCASTSLIPAVNTLATLPLLFAGTEEQKQRWLPLIADGSAMASYCLTEPGSGSDAAAMRSRAVRDGDDYVLNGTKRFITGGGVSKLYIYYTVTDPDAGSKGISAFILEDTMPGFEIGKHEDKLGIRGSPTTEVICNDVRVPAARRTRASPWPCAPSTTAGSPSAPRPSASPRAPLTTPSATPRNASSSARPSPTSRASSSCWPTWPCRSRPPAPSSTRPRPRPTATTPPSPSRPPPPNASPPTPPCGSPPTPSSSWAGTGTCANSPWSA